MLTRRVLVEKVSCWTGLVVPHLVRAFHSLVDHRSLTSAMRSRTALDHTHDVRDESPPLISKITTFIALYIVVIILPSMFLLYLVFRQTPLTCDRITNGIARNPRYALLANTAISAILSWQASQLWSQVIGWFAEVRSSEGIDTENLLFLDSLKRRSAESFSSLFTSNRRKRWLTVMNWSSFVTFIFLSGAYTVLFQPIPVTLDSYSHGWEPNFLAQEEECVNFFRDHYIDIADSTCGWQVRMARHISNICIDFSTLPEFL